MNTSPFASPEPWNAVADGYADESHWLMGAFSACAAELLPLDATTRVLDVACGPGTATLQIAPRVASVHALDFSPAMIARLERELAAKGYRNVTPLIGDGQALPFADASFDVAISMFGLMFFPDRPRGFREILRVLRPGGKALVSSWAPLATSPLMQAMFGGLRAADPSMLEPQPNPSSLENVEVLEKELRDAGFTDVVIHRREETVAIDDIDELWERMVRCSAPIVMMRRRVGEAEWEKRSAVACDWLRSSLGATPTTLSTTALLGVGVRP